MTRPAKTERFELRLTEKKQALLAAAKSAHLTIADYLRNALPAVAKPKHDLMAA